MTIKKSFKKYILNPSERRKILYVSSKRFFMCCAFVFFLVYFLLSANYYPELTSFLFLPVYISFVLSLVIFLSCFCIEFLANKVPMVIAYIICIGLCVGGAFFLIPI